ncbi:helix-turn-helix domain-containing protein [Butyrivibrio fibrisolvens]|uniref:helix-turn-helix domain-containing protein n=1 Tax=Pseudobutyrivibrio ruminis TaxID=46206 RepID=UPI00041CF34E|nr:helix-turn-helix transcriptional regulator [Pseudobutyrivibrio ruminis]MDC7278063.1 helix-turn-helix domain-containing protein [Butyrivibrio fibrisolvens]
MSDTNTINVKIGANIARLRKSIGISQEDFAFDIGYSKNHISHIERGNKNITRKVIDAVVEYFGIDEEELYK